MCGKLKVEKKMRGNISSTLGLCQKSVQNYKLTENKKMRKVQYLARFDIWICHKVREIMIWQKNSTISRVDCFTISYIFCALVPKHSKAIILVNYRQTDSSLLGNLILHTLFRTSLTHPTWSTRPLGCLDFSLHTLKNVQFLFKFNFNFT